MKKYAWVVALSLVMSAVNAQEPPQVLLFGVFHFANPKRDVVKVDQVDVSRPENQVYLEGLAKRICEFKPTAILLEFPRAREPEVKRQLDAHLTGELQLEINENHQIGFRVAKACGVRTIHGFDENEVHWKGDVLFEYLERSEPDLMKALNEEIARFTQASTAAHKELDLRELLKLTNDPEQDRTNKDFYLLTNAAGAGSTFEGADATASWWHRNIRMYANIQKHAKPGERLLVVAGQGHTAILRDFLAIDRRIVAADILKYL